jgi:hypothetical protein
MLSPHERTSLFEALRPPQGFTLDAAVGTSFTLDLEALLTAPIAFALYDAVEADPDEGEVEPVGLLEAIRRYAGRITLFCQAGQIAVPARRRQVFAWLEDGVVEVRAPRPGRLFHPKVWLARYRVPETGECLLRVLCATRNLTFDASWDTLLRAETELYHPAAAREPVAAQRELADLFRRLPRLGRHPLPRGRARAVADLATDLERVALLPPEPFDTLDFHVLGLEPSTGRPFPERSTAALVVSPFLGEELVEQLADEHAITALVSREESLDRIAPATLKRANRLAVLSPAVDVSSAHAEDGEELETDKPAVGGAVSDEQGDPGRQLAGLHAKLYLFDTVEGVRLYTGSANATAAAFDGNVEVLAELRGAPGAAGVDAVLDGTPGETDFADLLIDYQPLDEPVEPGDAEELDLRLDRLRHAFAAARFSAVVTPRGEDFEVRLASDAAPPSLEVDDLELMVWPITLEEGSSAQALDPTAPVQASFTVTLEGMSSFFAFRATARHGSARGSTTFLVNARLEGAPEDRHSRLLARMLRDRDRLLRYLLMLLQDQNLLPGGELAEGGGWLGRWLGAGWHDVPLVELLLRAVDRHPERLDHIERLLHDLADQRDELLPDGFEAIWEPIWRYRQQAGR